ncbi:hypothetical protein SMC26_43640 [Actinomadura fulvescens]|uniref:Uncharacterized protein n=1 Tax=Actinomadura fulvescens TaxID=46160 RepID=A0ABP6D9W0_9ACTN
MTARIVERIFAWWGSWHDVKVEHGWQTHFGACVRLDTLAPILEQRGWAYTQQYGLEVPRLVLHHPMDGRMVMLSAAHIDGRGWAYNLLSGDGQPSYIYIPCVPIGDAIQALELFTALPPGDRPGPWRPR